MSRSEETKAPSAMTSEDWALLPWRKLERQVYRLQKRIFRAAERGNVRAVFKPGDVLECDHIIPRHLGGDDRLMNLQLLHRHCHDQKTANLDAALAKELAPVSMTETI